MCILLLLATFLPVSPLQSAAHADGTSLAFDFEDGSTQGWYGRGDTVTVTQNVYHSGNYSLRSVGRTQGWNGPGHDLQNELLPNNTYKLEAYVRLAAGEAATTINMTVQRTSGGTTSYDSLVFEAAVTNGEWTKLTSEYSFAETATALSLYFESESTTASFMLDDITIEQVITAPPIDETITNDFEDGDEQGWTGRWNTVDSVDDYAHGGTYSLKSTGRNASWEGPHLFITDQVQQGTAYQVSGWARLPEGEADTIVNLSYRSVLNGAESYGAINHGTVVSGDGWTELSGQFTLENAFDELSIYFESPDNDLVFYIDDVGLGKAPIDKPDQLTNDFEDGTAQGWYGRSGNETLAANAAASRTGSYGLSVGGRTSSWHGPQLDVKSVMEDGQTYTISAWLKLPKGTADTKVSMTIQRTTDGQNHYENIGADTVKAGQWVKLEGEYKLIYPSEQLAVYFESADGPTLSFYVDDFLLQKNVDLGPITIEDDIASLKDVFADYFPIGTAFSNSEIVDLDGPDADLMKKHFNSITPGNVLKWDSTEPEEGQFNFTEADKAVQFGIDNGIAVRGHTLVWHAQAPDWIFYDDQQQLVGKEVLFQRLKTHIDSVVGRYEGQIYAWDVVNEVIDPSRPNGMRNSLWYQIAGEEYIEKAFQYAHEADPNAKLFINDYNTHEPLKRQYLYELIKRLQAKDIPIDGVGHQMHIDIENPTIGEIEKTITTFADLDMEQQITELDMSSYTNEVDKWTAFPLEQQIKQAHRYKALFDVFKKYEDDITAVIFWGKDDSNSWLRTFPVTRKNWPLLFDDRLQAKLAYWGLVDVSQVPIEMKHTTAADGTIAVDGQSELNWARARKMPVYENGEQIAVFQTMWEEGKLYLLVDTVDDSFDSDDAVEVFIDGNNGKTETYESNDRSHELRRSGQGASAGVEYEAVSTSAGYRIEAMLPLPEAAADHEIGFDLRFRNYGGSTDTQISWNDTTGQQHTDTSKLGTLTLGEGHRITEAVKGTPTIDGVQDVAWANAKEITTDRFVAGTEGSTAKVRTMWDEERLYVWASVTDSLLTKRSANTYEQDSIELFVDSNNGKTDAYESDDGQYRINYDNEASFNPASLEGTMISATRITSDGYVVEAAIDWRGAEVEPGTIIGFDVQANNDEDDNGTRDSVAVWNDETGQSYRSTASYGLLQLSGSNEEGGGDGTDTGSGGGSSESSSSFTVDPVTGDYVYPINGADGQLLIAAEDWKAAGEAGKAIRIQSGNVSAVFPPDSLAMALANGQFVRVQLALASQQEAAAAVSRLLEGQTAFHATGNVVTLQLEIVNGMQKTDVHQFAKPITVTIPLTGEQLGTIRQQLAGVYYLDGEQAEYAGGWFDDEGVTFKTNHFSTYALLEFDKVFADLQGHWAENDVKALAAKHIVTGIDDNWFAPSRSMTRGELVAMLVRAIQIAGIETTQVNYPFDDIEPSSGVGKAAAIAFSLGIVKGYQDKFRPNERITREEAATLVMRAYPLFHENVPEAANPAFTDSDAISSWAKESISKAWKLTIVQGYGNRFMPMAEVTRAEAAVMLNRMLSIQE